MKDKQEGIVFKAGEGVQISRRISHEEYAELRLALHDVSGDYARRDLTDLGGDAFSRILDFFRDHFEEEVHQGMKLDSKR